jgi:patatin-like phospholipase/acyl hydrolase
MATIRILTIDGGGSRGIVAAKLLNDLNSKFPNFYQKFNYYCGISTGSIILSLLLSGLSTEEVLHVYKTEISKIFNKNLARTVLSLNGMLYPKYSATYLESLLRAGLGDETLLSNIKTHQKLLLPVLDLNSKELSFLSNVKTPKQQILPEYRLWETVRASTAAPTYFSPHNLRAVNAKDFEDLWYKKYTHLLSIDAGLYSSSPVTLVLLWLLKNELVNPRADKIEILSIGCGYNGDILPSTEDIAGWGGLKWVTPVIELQAHTNMWYSHMHLETLYSSRLFRGKYLRLNPTMASGPYALDEVSKTFVEECENSVSKYLDLLHTQTQLKEFLTW